MAKKAYVYNGNSWEDLASSISDLSSYATTVDLDDYQLKSVAGLTLITTATFSAVSNFSVNSCFSATYDNYFITVTVPTCASTDVNFRLRATATDAATNYYWAQIRGTQSGTVSGAGANPGTSTQFSHSGAGDNICGDITLFNPFVTGKTSGQMRAFGGDGANYLQRMTGFTHSTSASYDGFSILFAGNTTGVIRVYGMAI